MQLLPGLYQVGGSLSGLTGDQGSGPFDDCNVYVLELSDQLVLVDCGNGTSWPEIERNMSMWDLDPSRISTVLLTHSHYDHANAAHLLKKRGVTIVAHPHTADSVASGDERCCGFLYHQQFVPVVVDRMVEDGEQFSIGSSSALSGEEDGLSVLAIHLPGHTLGCTVYSLMWRGRRVLFSGDVIGTLGYGHFGWSGSIDFDRDVYLQSLIRMAKLDFDVMLPGHGLCSFNNPRARVEVSLNEALMQWRF